MHTATFAAALAGVAVAATPALAGSVTGPLTDSDLTGVFTDEAWVAEARYGNNRGNGDWELGANVGGSLQNTNFVWGEGSANYRARVSWVSSGFLTLDILSADGDATLASISNEGPADAFNAIAIRAAAPRDGSASISDIDMPGASYAGEQLSVVQPPANERARSLLFTGFDLSESFTVTFAFEWVWDDARGSQPAFQVKAGNIIPLPGAAGLALAAMGVAGVRRRR
jgi:hypothetical protein